MEHDSIALPLQYLQKRKKCAVTFVGVDPSSGAVRPEDVASACNEHTVLVTVMLANNETGVIQPIRQISDAVKAKASSLGRSIFVHTDAAQAMGKIPVNVETLGVDYLTIVGHKFYGPRIGALYVRNLESGKTPLLPLLYGGGQERGYRPGTENTPMIVGLGRASQLISLNQHSVTETLRSLRDYFEASLKENTSSVQVNFENSDRLPNTTSVAFPNMAINSLELLALCDHLVASTGAACHSDRCGASKILISSGISEEVAVKTCRFSIGKWTSKLDLNKAVNQLKEVIEN